MRNYSFGQVFGETNQRYRTVPLKSMVFCVGTSPNSFFPLGITNVKEDTSALSKWPMVARDWVYIYKCDFMTSRQHTFSPVFMDFLQIFLRLGLNPELPN